MSSKAKYDWPLINYDQHIIKLKISIFSKTSLNFALEEKENYDWPLVNYERPIWAKQGKIVKNP